MNWVSRFPEGFCVPRAGVAGAGLACATIVFAVLSRVRVLITHPLLGATRAGEVFFGSAGGAALVSGGATTTGLATVLFLGVVSVAVASLRGRGDGGEPALSGSDLAAS